MSKLKSFPSFHQLDAMDCGPTCLRIIAQYYGKCFNIQFLREKCFITKTGVSLLGISDAAEAIGFRTRGVKITFKQLVSSKPFPCILHWNQNHFVVCYGINKKKSKYEIKISDPSGEKYTLNEVNFLKCWLDLKNKDEEMGTVLLLNPTPNFYYLNDGIESDKKTFKYFFRYLYPYKSQLIQLFIGLLLGSLFSLIFPFLTQSIVDQGIGRGNMSYITLVLIAQMVLFVTQLLVEFIRNWITLHVNTRISISIISDYLAKLMKLPIHFFDTKNIGDIMKRIGDNERVKSFLTGSTLTVLFSFINFIIFAIILAYYDVTILGIFVLGNTFYVMWILFFLRYRRKLDTAYFSQAAAEQSNLVQIITGMQDIKLNNNEKQQRWQWERIQVKLFKISIKGLALGQYQQLGSVFFSQTTSLLLSFIAARAVVEGRMTLGMMMAVSYIIGQLSGPIGQVISFVQAAQDAKISLERLNEINQRKDEDDEIDCKISKLPSDKTISIDNLYFSFDGANRNYVLNDISLLIPENRVTAIVGASGSGKTTLIKLILSFYHPNTGKIKIGDVLINDLNPHLWRQRTGAVLQDGFIFSDTITNNIAVGEDWVDMDRLLKAVEVANLKDYIESLPLKYKTQIGMDGNGMSLGQRQRVLIARAVYKEPDFLFFDEATNALDANNEKIILDNLKQFYTGRTVLIVAHRLSTIQNADNIIVMDKGRIVETGIHEELIKKNGVYYALVKNQLKAGIVG